VHSSSFRAHSESLPEPDALAAALERRLRAAQAERLPSVAAAVIAKGEVLWSGEVGLASCEEGVDASAETQYRIGSITKTFTAVATMQLRDAGELDLDDRLEQHLPEIANGAPTIRRLLAHLSGLQREAGEMFVTGTAPTIDEVIESMDILEAVLPAARAHHYSNLAFGLLGEVVARRGGSPYSDYVAERILTPLGLSRTTWEEQPPAAQGYLLDSYASTVRREPHVDLGGLAAMGQLWSTVGDLCAWASFLAEGREGILAPATADELWFPQVMVNPDDWSVGWGLGLKLTNRGGRIFGGHGGAMPGFLAGVTVHRGSGVGAATLTNAGTGAAMETLAQELAEHVLELRPPQPEPWRPEREPPQEVRAILGRWWSEGEEFLFSWRDGRLRAEPAEESPPWARPAVFEQLGEREYRVVSGRERGERLRVEDDRLVWAGYAFTRDQRTF
jgi:CubicO group peptidase (beta-lactamase class C family)